MTLEEAVEELNKEPEPKKPAEEERNKEHNDDCDMSFQSCLNMSRDDSLEDTSMDDGTRKTQTPEIKSSQ